MSDSRIHPALARVREALEAVIAEAVEKKSDFRDADVNPEYHQELTLTVAELRACASALLALEEAEEKAVAWNLCGYHLYDDACRKLLEQQYGSARFQRVVVLQFPERLGSERMEG